MKIFKIFAAAFAAVALMALMASCSKEEPVNGGGAAGEETFTGISIVLKDGNATRAVADEAGTSAEGAINDVTVFVIDDATNQMQIKTFTAAQLGAPEDGYRAASEAILTTVGTKTVFVVANITPNLKAQLTTAAAVKTNALALTESAFYTGTFDGTPASLTNVVMSGKSASTLVAKQTAAQAIAAPISVDISRNVAKISTKWAAAPVMTGGTVTDAKFALAAKVNQSYLVAHTQTALYTLPETDPEDIDPSYYNNFSARTGLTYQNVNAAATDIDAAGAWFALEHKPETFLMGNTTMIVVSGVWTPTTGTVVTGYNATAPTPITLGNLTTGDSFWVNKTTEQIWNQTAYDAALASSNYVATDFSEEYVDGVGYYQVNIIDGSADRNRGVVRNNIYEMTINSILGPGDPTEDGGDDDEDPNLEESNIAVSIKPIDWTFNNWGEDLQ